MDILDHDVDVDEVLAGSDEWGFSESSSVGTHSRRTRRLTTTDATTTTNNNYSATMASVVESVEGAAEATGSNISMLDGVDPSSLAFAHLAETTVEATGTGGCSARRRWGRPRAEERRGR